MNCYGFPATCIQVTPASPGLVNGMHGLEHLQALELDENTEMALIIVDCPDLGPAFPDSTQHAQLRFTKGTCNSPDAFEYACLDSFQFSRLEIDQRTLDQRLGGSRGR